jgi:hypothetical protein
VLGKDIRWTITVKNNSTADAADVNVVRVSERVYRLKVVSITPSQGTCNLDGCNLGRLAPGASATITVQTRAIRVGRVLNVVRVSSEEQESNYLNNTAGALVRITAPLPGSVVVKAASIRRACSTLVAEPRVLRVGSTSVVLTTARNRWGRPLQGLVVHAVGLGLRERAVTNARGVAQFAVTPPRNGIIGFAHGARLPAGVRSSCRTLLGALGTSIRPVTG